MSWVYLRFGRIICANRLLRDLGPAKSILQPRLLLGVEPTELDERLDEGREALVTESATYDGLGLRDVVEVAERHRVAVRVRDEGVRRRDVVRLRVRHEVRTRDVQLLPLG